MSGGVLYLDPSLGVSRGHHEPLARSFAALAGLPIHFAGAHGGRFPDLPQDASFEPLFMYRLEDAFRVSRSGAPWQARGLGKWVARAGRRMGATFAAHPPAQFSALFRDFGAETALGEALKSPASDVVSVGADPATVSALHGLQRVLDAPSAPRLHIVFMYPERDFLPGGRATDYFELIRTMLTWRRPPFLYAELAEHAEDLAGVLSAPVAHQILPYRWPPTTPPRPSDPFTVAVLGAGRVDKGFAALPEIVAAARGSEIMFRIQRPARRAGLGGATRSLEGSSDVTLLPAELSAAAYDAELGRAHLVLIAYDPNRYARRGSGVFVDALLFGRPIVCVADTALARMLKGNGLSAKDSVGVAAALSEARRDYAALFAAAAREREHTLMAIRNGPLFSALRGAGAA